MVRKKTLADLEPWLEHAHSSLIASFAAGVLKEREAVRAAVSLPWSNGQTEGQITKLKLVRRQMYGRGKIGLQQARVIGAQCSAAPPKLRQTQFCTPDHTQALNGAEVRFLRLEMNTTQKNLAAFLGVEQAVRRWEKARTKPVTNDPADSLVRAVYAEYVNKKSDVYRMIRRLTDLDQIEPTSGRLFETDKGWRQEGCAPCLRSTPGSGRGFLLHRRCKGICGRRRASCFGRRSLRKTPSGGFSSPPINHVLGTWTQRSIFAASTPLHTQTRLRPTRAFPLPSVGQVSGGVVVSGCSLIRWSTAKFRRIRH